MTLARKIKKLQAQGRQVVVKKYYLFDVDSYHAPEWAVKFFVGLGCVMVLGFFIWWGASAILVAQHNSSNVELRRLEIDRESQERIDKEAAKQKYVDACKAAGTRPTDMSDYEAQWECK